MTTGSFGYDPEYLDAMMKLMALLPAIEPPTEVTIASMREFLEQTLPVYRTLTEPQPDVTFERFSHARADGSALDLRWYTRDGSEPAAAAVFVHGGGMVMGDLEMYDPIVAKYVANSGVPMLAVEYRLAPEHPHPAALDDVVAAVQWLHEHAPDLGTDPTRIAIMGDSGGGGIAAGAALACRDRGIPLAAQILIYPMIDDRNREPDPALVPFAGWPYDNNAVAWDAVVGRGATEVSHEVSPYAAAARATDLAGLPRTYLDTGELDIFRAEVLAYAARLTAAGVSTELHLHPGVPHAFEVAAPDIDVSKRALADRYRFLRGL
ncbi:MAG: alpha/beta hydrolase [Marmoricola sp.]|nr:alpha/beta hydrolase [Marmoricola sp.]